MNQVGFWLDNENRGTPPQMIINVAAYKVLERINNIACSADLFASREAAAMMTDFFDAVKVIPDTCDCVDQHRCKQWYGLLVTKRED